MENSQETTLGEASNQQSIGYQLFLSESWSAREGNIYLAGQASTQRDLSSASVD